MNKILETQNFLDDNAKMIVDKSLEELAGTSDGEKVDVIVNNHIRNFYFSINSYDQESGLINVLKGIAVQYVALLKREQEASQASMSP